MRTLRIRIRTLMIVVAIVALAMSVLLIGRQRSIRLAREAEKYARIAAFYQARKKPTAALYYREKSLRYARAAGHSRTLAGPRLVPTPMNGRRPTSPLPATVKMSREISRGG